MAAPTPTARIKPAGYQLPDGYRSQITFSSNPSIPFWEKTVKPPGFDGGEPIDQTTMQNDAYRTMAARSLKTLTPSTIKVAYDPDFTTAILALINVNQTLTHEWPTVATLAYYAYLQKIEFDDLEEGKAPEATLTIVPTNYDPTNKVEAAPVHTPSAGT